MSDDKQIVEGAFDSPGTVMASEEQALFIGSVVVGVQRWSVVYQKPNNIYLWAWMQSKAAATSIQMKVDDADNLIILLQRAVAILKSTSAQERQTLKAAEPDVEDPFAI